MIGETIARMETADTKKQLEVSFRDIKPENDMSVKDLKDSVKAEFEKASKEFILNELSGNGEMEGLSKEDWIRIKEETNWPDEIIDYIYDMDQYVIYKNAGLHVEEVNGRLCLVKDIDMDYVDPKTNKTNRQRMENGWCPIDPQTGEKIELHHMGQDYDSPFAELTENSEHGDGNQSKLHPKTEGSWRNDPNLKNRYNNVDKPGHWQARAKEA